MFKRLTQQVREVDEQLNLSKKPYTFKVLQIYILTVIYLTTTIGLCKTLKKNQLYIYLTSLD